MEKRKTVNGEDILFAMTSLGFENYAEALKVYLSKYREVSRTHSHHAWMPGRTLTKVNLQQQNQSNRERVGMEAGASWQGSMMGDKPEGGGEASTGLEGAPDANFMYTSQPGHNGNGAGDSY